MTTNPTEQTTNPPQDAADAPDSAHQDTEAPEGTESPTTPDPADLMAESRKYREKLRESKAANEDLTERLSNAEAARDAVLRDTISRQLPDRLSPDLFWKLTPDLGPLLNENGVPDNAAIQTAAEALIHEYGLTPPPPIIRSQGKTPEMGPPNISLSDAFRPRHD